MKSLDEFTRSGGKLTGGSHGSHEEYEGQPRHYNEKLSTTFDKLGLHGSGASHQSHDSGVSGVGHTSGTGMGHNSGGMGSGVGHTSGTGMGHNNGGIGSGVQNTQGYNSGHHGHGAGAGALGAGVGAASVGAAAHQHRRRGSNSSSSSSSDESVGGTRRKKDKLSRKPVGGGMAGSGTTGSHVSGNDSGRTKPSLMDRLNPRKDADGDGKAGFGK